MTKGGPTWDGWVPTQNRITMARAAAQSVNRQPPADSGEQSAANPSSQPTWGVGRLRVPVGSRRPESVFFHLMATNVYRGPRENPDRGRMEGNDGFDL